MMRKIFKNIIRSCYLFLRGIVFAFRNSMKKTYYPECKRKKIFHRLFDNIKWAFVHKCDNPFYCLYGMDIKGSKTKGFIDENIFWKNLKDINNVGKSISQVPILRDKFLFYKYMKSINLPVAEVFAVMFERKLYEIDTFNEVKYDFLIDAKDYFIKDIDGQCASYVKHINDYEDFLKINIDMKNKYLFQKKVIQHIEMSKLNENAINTLRIVTVNNNGEVYVLTSLLRVGTKQSGKVDNWAAGGIAVGIQNNGFLKEFGYYKPNYGIKTDMHPDSKIIFSEFKVPMYEMACKIALQAHRFFYNIRTIGWDIAITPEGPLIIEGNDNWEISLMQACDRPLLKEWKKIIK